jgi:hypothetical protein
MVTSSMRDQLISRRVIAALIYLGTPAFDGLAPASALAQGARGAAAPACRTGVGAYRIENKGAVTSTVTGSCTFNAAAVEGTCTNDYSDSTGRKLRSVSVTRHATIADVVEEVSVNPPLQRALGTTTTLTGAGTETRNTSTLEYDAQKRLVSVIAESRPSGQRSITTYTAWDAEGRPTAATIVTGGQAITQVIRYDNARRSQSMTSNGVTCTQAFDQNGNPALSSCDGGSTASTTILATQRICR